MREKRIFNKNGGPLEGAVFRSVEQAVKRLERLGVLPLTGSKVVKVGDAVAYLRTSEGMLNIAVDVPHVEAEIPTHMVPYESFAFVVGGTAYGDFKAEKAASSGLVESVFHTVFSSVDMSQILDYTPSSIVNAYDAYELPPIATAANHEQLVNIEVLPVVRFGARYGKPTYDPVITSIDTGGFLQVFRKTISGTTRSYLIRGVKVSGWDSTPADTEAFFVHENMGSWAFFPYPFPYGADTTAHVVYWPDNMAAASLIKNPSYQLSGTLTTYANLQFPPPEDGSVNNLYVVAGKRCVACGEVCVEQEGITRAAFTKAPLQPIGTLHGLPIYDIANFERDLAESSVNLRVGRLGDYLVPDGAVITGFNEDAMTAVAFDAAAESSSWVLMVDTDLWTRFPGFDFSLGVSAGDQALTYAATSSFVDDIRLEAAIEGVGFEFVDGMFDEQYGVTVEYPPEPAASAFNPQYFSLAPSTLHTGITPISPAVRARGIWTHKRPQYSGSKTSFYCTNAVKFVYTQRDVELTGVDATFVADHIIGGAATITLFPIELIEEIGTDSSVTYYYKGYTPFAHVKSEVFAAYNVTPGMFLQGYSYSVTNDMIPPVRNDVSAAPAMYRIGSSRFVGAALPDVAQVRVDFFGETLEVSVSAGTAPTSYEVPTNVASTVTCSYEAVSVATLRSIITSMYDMTSPGANIEFTADYDGLFGYKVSSFEYPQDVEGVGFLPPSVVYRRHIDVNVVTDSPSLTECAYSDSLPETGEVTYELSDAISSGGRLFSQALAVVYSNQSFDFSGTVAEISTSYGVSAVNSFTAVVGDGTPVSVTGIGSSGVSSTGVTVADIVNLYNAFGDNLDGLRAAASGYGISYANGPVPLPVAKAYELLFDKSFVAPVSTGSSMPNAYAVPAFVSFLLSGPGVAPLLLLDTAHWYTPSAYVRPIGDVSAFFTSTDIKAYGLPQIAYVPRVVAVQDIYTSQYQAAAGVNLGDQPCGLGLDPSAPLRNLDRQTRVAVLRSVVSSILDASVQRAAKPIASLPVYGIVSFTTYSSAVNALEAQALETGFLSVSDLVSERTGDSIVYWTHGGVSLFYDDIVYPFYGDGYSGDRIPPSGCLVDKFLVYGQVHGVGVPPDVEFTDTPSTPGTLPAMKFVGGVFPPAMHLGTVL